MVNLSTREWAAVIWGMILFICIITKEEPRRSFFDFIKMFFGKKLRVLWIIYFFYIFGITILFSLLPFWDIIFIKDIAIWSIFSGLVYYINVASRESDETYIKNIIRDNFKLIIIFEFFMSTFTFNIFIELLIIPIFTVILIMSFISEREIKYQNVHKLINYLFVLLGFIFVFKTIEIGINEYKNLSLLDTFLSFIIPIIFLICTLPLIFMLGIYSKYESLFSGMSFKEGLDKKNNLKRRFYVLRTCNISIKKILIFQKNICQECIKICLKKNLIIY